jgi:hypothetical protein
LVSDYLKQLVDKQQVLLSLSKVALEKQANSRRKLQPALADNTVFKVGDYALVAYPSRSPHKLAPLYRGPMIITSLQDDLVVLTDLLSSKTVERHINDIRVFQVPDDFLPTEALQLAAADKDIFVVEAIVEHRGSTKRNLKFQVRWLGHDPSEDTMLSYQEAKDLVALHTYLAAHPELKLK